MAPRITLVTGNDWQGLYVDGVLVAENHSLSAHDAIQALGFTCAEVTPDEEWLEAEGQLPKRLKGVKRA